MPTSRKRLQKQDCGSPERFLFGQQDCHAAAVQLASLRGDDAARQDSLVEARGPGGGGLGDILGGILAGGAGGGALGNVLNGGLGDILKQLQEGGHGDVADSWVGTGKNKSIDPRDLEDALGPEKMKSLAEQAGMSNLQFMQGLAAGLPQVIDHMTPDGRLPTRAEAERWV